MGYEAWRIVWHMENGVERIEDRLEVWRMKHGDRRMECGECRRVRNLEDRVWNMENAICNVQDSVRPGVQSVGHTEQKVKLGGWNAETKT